jgi:hypothetical protein
MKPTILKSLALAIAVAALLTTIAQRVRADEPNPVTAIDILFDPDATMMQHAQAANECLRKSFPEGFAYVADYVPSGTGKKFNSHVTIGLASQDYLKKMLDEKFEAFMFSPSQTQLASPRLLLR